MTLNERGCNDQPMPQPNKCVQYTQYKFVHLEVLIHKKNAAL